MAAVEQAVMARFFTAETLAAENPRVETTRTTLLATNPSGYAGCCGAIIGMNNIPLLSGITAPALLIVGDRDVSTPWEGHGELLAREIPGVQVCRLNTAHLANIEDPSGFAASVLNFIT
jgi:3-oxoadipate enol-lactonase/4-carboxymuconolactone decarboxylase